MIWEEHILNDNSLPFPLLGLEDPNSELTVLSTGELRKVFLGKTLEKNPVLCVLDEPFDGLDSPSRIAMLNTLQRMADARICQFIVITHRFEEMPAFVTHLLVLRDGHIVASGKKEDLLQRDTAWEDIVAKYFGDTISKFPIPHVENLIEYDPIFNIQSPKMVLKIKDFSL